jgi:hypothetical protein
MFEAHKHEVGDRVQGSYWTPQAWVGIVDDEPAMDRDPELGKDEYRLLEPAISVSSREVGTCNAYHCSGMEYHVSETSFRETYQEFDWGVISAAIKAEFEKHPDVKVANILSLWKFWTEVYHGIEGTEYDEYFELVGFIDQDMLRVLALDNWASDV